MLTDDQLATIKETYSYATVADNGFDPSELLNATRLLLNEVDRLQTYNKQMQSALAQFSDGENWEDEHGVYIWRMFNDPQQLAEHALIHNEQA